MLPPRPLKKKQKACFLEFATSLVETSGFPRGQEMTTLISELQGSRTRLGLGFPDFRETRFRSEPEALSQAC